MEVVRFAPSPTGWLHLGHAYLAAFADRASVSGRFILRIEDIDASRTRPEFYDGIFEDLSWLGLRWEEPVLYQARRMEAYQDAMARLIAEDAVYPCFCSRAEIAAATEAPHEKPPEYPGTCRGLPAADADAMIAAGRPFAWRLDVGRALGRYGELSWFDHGQGLQHVPLIGDPVIARKDIPTSYHLSCILDDAHQGITLVTRGADLFESTHVHRVLQAVLGLATPAYHHHPLVGDEFGHRLSKRDGSIALRSMRAEGLSPEQVLRRANERLIGID